MRRSRSGLGRRLAALDLRLDIPPSVRGAMERELSATSLRDSALVILRFFRTRALVRARLSEMTPAQRDLVLRLANGEHAQARPRDARALVQLGILATRRSTRSSAPKLTDLGLRVAEGERLGRQGDVVAALRGLRWRDKKKAEWAISVLARAFGDNEDR